MCIVRKYSYLENVIKGGVETALFVAYTQADLPTLSIVETKFKNLTVFRMSTCAPEIFDVCLK